MLTIYTITYNEELKIKCLIDYYRSKFTNCNIIVYDNMSTDNTVKICKENNCTVIPFDTNNQFQDAKHIEIKNNCWKSAPTNWVLVCDADEHLHISQEQLNKENSTIIRSEAYHMVNMADDLNIENIKYGVRAQNHDKCLLFNKSFIKEINYDAGGHNIDPIGNIIYSSTPYKLYHYHFINVDDTINRYAHYAKRLSKENLKNNWGYHYLTSKEKIAQEFEDLRKKAIKLLP